MVGNDGKVERDARLAAALRANLRRRKRLPATNAPPAPDTPTAAGPDPVE